ncbi:MAG: GNAT family N-acetyltransferase [Cyclobacteriaceae bacterium]
MEFQISLFEQRDLGKAMLFKNEEGWNQTQKDWELFLKENPDSCLVAKSGMETIATVTAYNYQNRLAWIGMMLVDKNYRGRGISKALMKAIIQKLKACNTIKLDATPAGRHVYEKLGFEKEYSLFRMIKKTREGEHWADLLYSVDRVLEKDLPAIFEWDKKVFGADRSALIQYLFHNFPEGSFKLLNDDILKGFLFCRKGTRYLQLGPMVAENDEMAKSLLTRAMDSFGSRELVLDISMERKNLIQWLVGVGFEVQRELIRMFLNHNEVKGKPSQYYLICGPEFG